MVSSNDLRPGVTVEYRDSVWQVIDAMHVKPGKGSAFVQTKLRNVQTDDVLAVNFRAGERLSAADVETLKLVFIYRECGHYILMNTGDAESFELDATQFGRNLDLLAEGLEDITVKKHRGKVIRVDLPNTVALVVRETAPNERGNTSSGSGKQAILETGATVTVPFHVKIGDKNSSGYKNKGISGTTNLSKSRLQNSKKAPGTTPGALWCLLNVAETS